MFRAACAVAGLIALAAPRFDVDAVSFALAFRDGKADQFRHTQISGYGTNFHGAVTERLADGSTRISLVMTLGAVDSAAKLTPLNTWDEFVAAERARTTLVVALSGPDLPPPPTNAPTVYEFSGVYDGQVRTIARAPEGRGLGQTSTPDTPCPGEKPRTDQGGSFYCAPLLTGATATIRR